MAVPPSYGGDGRVRIARLPQPGANAAQIVGEAGAQVGQEMFRANLQHEDNQTRIAVLEDRRNLEAHTADRAAALAEAQSALLGDLQSYRAAPNGTDHEARVAERIEKFRTDFMGTLADRRLVNDFAPDVARIAGSATLSEQGWAIQQRSAALVNNAERTRDTLGNTLFTNPSTANLANADALWNRTLDAMDMPDTARAELRRQGISNNHVRAWQGAMEVNPSGALEALDAGALNDYAQEGQIVQLRNAAQAAIAREQSAARAAASATGEQARAGESVLIEQVNNGTLVDTGQLQAAFARASAGTDPADVRMAHDLGVALTRNMTNARYDSASPAERTAAIREIEGRANWQQNEALVIAHDQLGRLNGRDASRVSNDMLGLYSRQTHTALQPATLADPASMGRRFAIGDAAATRYGRPAQYLTEEEAAPIREAWNSGTPASRADFIRTLSAYGGNRAKGILRQLAPARPEWAQLVDLATMRDRAAGGQLVREALDGRAQMAANPRLLGGSERARESAMRDLGFGTALQALPGTVRQGVIFTAEGIYAHRAAGANAERFNPELWGQAMQAALGQAGDTGGVVHWRGGATVALPRGMTHADMEGLIARADGAAFRRASGGDGAMWHDGSGNPQQMTVGAFRELVPELISDSGGHAIYQFRSSSGYAQSQLHPGQPYVIDVRALRHTRAR